MPGGEPLLNLPCDCRSWYKIVKCLDAFNDCTSTADLQTSLRHLYRSSEIKLTERRYLKQFEGLIYFLDKISSENEQMTFYNVLLPIIARRTACMACVQRPSPFRNKFSFVLKRIELSDDLVASLVCASFLGILPPNNPKISPNISASFRYLQGKDGSFYIANLRYLFSYIESLTEEKSPSSIVYTRIGLRKKGDLNDWMNCSLPLCKLSVHSVSPPGHALMHIATKECMPHLAVITNLLYDKLASSAKEETVDVIQTLGDKRDVFVLLDNRKEAFLNHLEKNFLLTTQKGPVSHHVINRSLSPSAINLEQKFIHLDALAGDIAQKAVFEGTLEAQNVMFEAYNLYLARRSSCRSSTDSSSSSGTKQSHGNRSSTSSSDFRFLTNRRTSAETSSDLEFRRRNSASSRTSVESTDYEIRRQSSRISCDFPTEVIKEEMELRRTASSNRTDNEKLFKHSVSSLVDDMLSGTMEVHKLSTDDEKSVVMPLKKCSPRSRRPKQVTFERQLRDFCSDLVKRSMLSARAELEIEFRPNYLLYFADMFVKRVLDDAVDKSQQAPDRTLSDFHSMLVSSAPSPSPSLISPVAESVPLQLEPIIPHRTIKLRRRSMETLLSGKWQMSPGRRRRWRSVSSGQISWYVQDLLVESFDAAFIELFGSDWDRTSTDVYKREVENWSTSFTKDILSDALKSVYVMLAKQPSSKEAYIENLSNLVYHDALSKIVRNSNESLRMRKVVLHSRREDESMRTLLEWAAASRAGVSICYLTCSRHLSPKIRFWQKKFANWTVGQLVCYLAQIECFDD